MGERHAPAMVVTGDDGHLLGVITPLAVARLVAMEGGAARAPGAPEPRPLSTPLAARG